MSQRIPFQVRNFSLVVCRHPNGKYLAVKKTRDRGWWLPSGYSKQGESFMTTAHQKVLEEAGIHIELKGVLRVEHSVRSLTQAKMRVIFFAIPADSSELIKTIKDQKCDEARWVTTEELKDLAIGFPGLKGFELYEWGNYIEKGGRVAPLHILCREEESAHCDLIFFTIRENKIEKPEIQLLITAIKEADENSVKKLLFLGINFDITINEKMWTPLHLACYLQHEVLVYLLLLAGVSITALTNKCQNIAHFAAQTNTRIMKMVLIKLSSKNNSKEIINQKDYAGNSPLNLAFKKFGAGEILNLLIKHGANNEICYSNELQKKAI